MSDQKVIVLSNSSGLSLSAFVERFFGADVQIQPWQQIFLEKLSSKPLLKTQLVFKEISWPSRRSGRRRKAYLLAAYLAECERRGIQPCDKFLSSVVG